MTFCGHLAWTFVSKLVRQNLSPVSSTKFIDFASAIKYHAQSMTLRFVRLPTLYTRPRVPSAQAFILVVLLPPFMRAWPNISNLAEEPLSILMPEINIIEIPKRLLPFP